VQPPAKGKKNAAIPPHSHLDSAPNQVELAIAKRRGTFMKFVTIGALIAAHIACAAQAAELPRDPSTETTRIGSFAGARVRVPLGATKEKPHAGLAFTATQRTGDTGALRFSKGMELGFAGDGKVRLSLAGKPVSQLRPGAEGPAGRKLGVSTLGWVGIGVAVALVAGTIWFVDAMNDASE
jgi:hypothetical protein